MMQHAPKGFSMPDADLVFVYGTLRCGQSNHAVLARAAYCGAHRTPARYTMFDLGPYPAVVEEGRYAIAGEVYRIDAAMLETLDLLEDYPHLYGRARIRTLYGTAWMYLYRQTQLRAAVVTSGDWLQRHRTARSLGAAGGTFG
jgi:gamma-glutamylcyclotransferase (GGCT)/AIG2-like uncharacterized protein YtfP